MSFQQKCGAKLLIDELSVHTVSGCSYFPIDGISGVCDGDLASVPCEAINGHYWAHPYMRW